MSSRNKSNYDTDKSRKRSRSRSRDRNHSRDTNKTRDRSERRGKKFSYRMLNNLLKYIFL